MSRREIRGWNNELYKLKVHFDHKFGKPRCGVLGSLYQKQEVELDINRVTCERCIRLMKEADDV